MTSAKLSEICTPDHPLPPCPYLVLIYSTLWIRRIWNRGCNALHQLGQPIAPSVLFPVFPLSTGYIIHATSSFWVPPSQCKLELLWFRAWNRLRSRILALFFPLIMMIPDPALFHWNRLHLVESAPVLESAPLLVKSIVKPIIAIRITWCFLIWYSKYNFFFIILWIQCESVMHWALSILL